MNIIGWYTNETISKQLTKSGARYIWEITFDPDTQTARFVGQSRDSVTATLAELDKPAVQDTPRVTAEDQKTFPLAPAGWKYTNLVNPNQLKNDPAHYPVLLYNGITYTGTCASTTAYWQSPLMQILS